MANKRIARGARGGNAFAKGEGSTAIGGDAGRSGLQSGGRGGDVVVTEPNTTAVGGKGGRGGIGPGMPGMDIIQPVGDYAHGGMGGEAAQPDGRGGRGGLSGGREHTCKAPGTLLEPHMKRPYWDDKEIEPGRGGDSPDTPQYRARRLIIEMIKADYLAAPEFFTTSVWYDRKAVPIDAINAKLAEAGHKWKIAVDDHEYAITDLPAPE